MYIQKTIYNDDMRVVEDPNRIIEELRTGELNDEIRFRTPQSSLSIKYKNIMTLLNKMEPSFLNLADGSIITLFDKTPLPMNENDVVCPHFVELKWANGCKFNCSWCYLNGTFRFRPMGKKPYLKDIDKIKVHLENYFNQVQSPTILNSGELSDSLVFEGNGKALSKVIIPMFKTQNTHKLLILTKSSKVSGIERSNSQAQVIVSFSVNSFEVAKRWEKGAPSPKQRIKAAKKLYNSNYEVRIRLDPIIPVENWKDEYKQLIDHLFENLTPERITLGSLRGLQSTINNSSDRSWVEYLDETSNWGKKISFGKRSEIYSFIKGYLEKEYNFKKIGLCKETVGMWGELGMDYREIKCNCIF